MIFEYLIKQKIDIDFNKLYQEQLKLSYDITPGGEITIDDLIDDLSEYFEDYMIEIYNIPNNAFDEEGNFYGEEFFDNVSQEYTNWLCKNFNPNDFIS